MNLDLGSESVQFVAWKSQEKNWVIDGESCEITKILLDPDSVKTGQGKLAEGQAPEWIWNEYPGQKVKLQEGFKKAFSCEIFISEKYGSPVSEYREWQSAQRASREALMKAWPDIEKDKENNKNKMVILGIEGSTPMQVGPAKINVPILKVEGWAKKPNGSEAPAPAPVEKKAIETEF